MVGGSLRELCKQTGDMATFTGVIEHHAERCEAAQRIDEREPLSGNICFSARHEQSQRRRGTRAARARMPGSAAMHSK
jgi:hypothetical protein